MPLPHKMLAEYFHLFFDNVLFSLVAFFLYTLELLKIALTGDSSKRRQLSNFFSIFLFFLFSIFTCPRHFIQNPWTKSEHRNISRNVFNRCQQKQPCFFSTKNNENKKQWKTICPIFFLNITFYIFYGYVSQRKVSWSVCGKPESAMWSQKFTWYTPFL